RRSPRLTPGNSPHEMRRVSYLFPHRASTDAGVRKLVCDALESGFDGLLLFFGDLLLHGTLLADPGHHRAELLADFLDQVLLITSAQGREDRSVRLVFQDPIASELARLDLVERLLHLGADVIVDDARAAGQVAVLGGIGDG